MSYTGTEIFNMSIALMDELSPTGTINETQVSDYMYRAPYLLDLWQHEISKIENLSEVSKVESLDDDLEISERGCISGAYYLAMHFAMADGNTEMTSLFKQKYDELKRDFRLPKDFTNIVDVYNISDGSTSW